MEQKKIAAGVFVLCPNTERVLLLKRGKGVKYAGYWGFPGGSFDEEDGGPKVTALREFEEETGYKGEMRISKEPLYIENSNHLDFYSYLCLIPNEFIPNLKGERVVGNEHDEYAWFELDVKSNIMMPTIIKILNEKKCILDKAIKKFKNER